MFPVYWRRIPRCARCTDDTYHDVPWLPATKHIHGACVPKRRRYVSEDGEDGVLVRGGMLQRMAQMAEPEWGESKPIMVQKQKTTPI
ncbi:hypothetical protein Tco_1559802 [Tanacetum coccineum]